jgi:cephalosporin-C deacetylase-like acetyl esterase
VHRSSSAAAHETLASVDGVNVTRPVRAPAPFSAALMDATRHAFRTKASGAPGVSVRFG